MKIVAEIIEKVKLEGDKAVNFYSEKFDNEKIREVSKKEIKKAYSKIDKNLINTLKDSSKNIKQFAEEQMKQIKSFETTISKNIIGQKIVPIQKIGCYVPGGRYPLPSSALMSIIPAKIAGVKEIIICSPKIQPITIVAADIAGADKIYSVGGIQAIVAMAYGTETIPKVDKIVGPGNKFVTEAKRQVYGDVGIDFIAGPSEVMIIADETANPKLIAADLLSQAEHDTEAKTYLIAKSQEIIDEVNKEISKQLKNLMTKEVTKISIKNLETIIFKDIQEAVKIANQYAPEHLELQIKSPNLIIYQLINYGSLFIGKNSAEVFGDYCSGTNHILPTNGAARYTGGLSVFDFVKILTYQRITNEGKNKLIRLSSNLAKIEGLNAHKKSAEFRK